jgi:predicted nucleic acid-binding protein
MLVDTSVWIDHIRRPERRLIDLLEDNAVDVHVFIIGELACGQLRPRDELTRLLRELPLVPTVDHEEALTFLERYRLHRRGIGWVDLHLLASARLAGTPLWTRDRRMAQAAGDLLIELYG